MRKIIFGVGISIDGYIARADGSVDFLFMPKDFSMAPFFKAIDTAIMGRKTLDVSLKMGGGSFGASMKTYVYTRTVPAGERDGMIFTQEPPSKLVATLRKAQGKDIWLMGGGELAREFLKEDLVDEVHLGVVPVLLGEGIPAFAAGFTQLDFKLTESKTYLRGLVSLKYERKRVRVRGVRSRPS
jgi:dihydrofolate reductase